jgi:putative hydroxymethylpyrimidine transport system substrate-binding protein
VRRRLAALACALAAAVALAGCGEREERLSPGPGERMEVRMEAPNAGHAGIYAARERRHFRAAGLDVRIATTDDPVEDVAAGRADLAVAPQHAVLEARDRGRRVVSVAAIVHRPLSSVMWTGASGLRELGDLRGRVVGTQGTDVQSAFLNTIVERAGAGAARERTVRGGFTRALVGRDVDAVVGAYLNREGVDPRLTRRRATTIPVDRAGVPPFAELVVVAREGGIEDDAGPIRSFLGAAARGTRDLRTGPGRAAAVEALAEADRRTPAAVHRRGIARTLPLLQPPRDRLYGYQDGGTWRALAAWMRDNRLLERREPANEAHTSELLPGRGP